MRTATQQLLRFLLLLSLSSCAVNYSDLQKDGLPYIVINEAEVIQLQSEELKAVPPAKRKPVIAVYANSLQDLTGQRKSNGQFALFSTAITQAPEAYLIRALKHTANGRFYQVVERVGLDSLTKERQLIRSSRDNFGEESEVLPLLLAGLLFQGGVLSYDTNIKSGGIGGRLLGISSSKQWREDTITVSLRLVSVSTGEVLIETLTSKTVLSVALSQDVFRFISQGSELLELEGGVSENESTSIALQRAIESAVHEITLIGVERGYWEYE